MTKVPNTQISSCQPPITWSDQEHMVNDWLMQLTHKAEFKWVMKSPVPQVNPESNGRFSELCHKNAGSPYLITAYNNWGQEFTRFLPTCSSMTTLRTVSTARFRTRNTLKTNKSTRTNPSRTCWTITTWLMRFQETVSRWRNVRLPTTQSSWPTSRKLDKIILLDFLMYESILFCVFINDLDKCIWCGNYWLAGNFWAKNNMHSSYHSQYH